MSRRKKAETEPAVMGRPRISDETRALVCRLYDEDELTIPQIAKSVNISARSVCRIVSERAGGLSESEV